MLRGPILKKPRLHYPPRHLPDSPKLVFHSEHEILILLYFKDRILGDYSEQVGSSRNGVWRDRNVRIRVAVFKTCDILTRMPRCRLSSFARRKCVQLSQTRL